MHGVLSLREAPDVRPSRHCFQPHACEFWQRCTTDKPDWVFYIPRLSSDSFDALELSDVVSMKDVPDNFPLDPKQRRVVDVAKSAKVYRSPKLAEMLELLAPPASYLELLDCLVVEDVGRIVNPLTLHGQAIGGMVQGLGGAFLEHLVYDANGQLLAGNLADYLIPTATDFPKIRAIALENHRSPSNPLGVKGAGRGRDHPDRRPDSQRRRQCFDLVRSDAEPAAALARPRLAHEFGQAIHPWFGMTVDRFGNSPDKRAEPRYPAPTAPARPRNRAREKGATTQTHRARVLEVRIHLPPAASPLRTRFGRRRLCR